jgi:hypothetical protein
MKLNEKTKQNTTRLISWGTLLQIKKMRVYELYLYMVYTKKNKSGVGAHAHNMYNVDPSLVLIDVLQF